MRIWLKRRLVFTLVGLQFIFVKDWWEAVHFCARTICESPPYKYTLFYTSRFDSINKGIMYTICDNTLLCFQTYIMCRPRRAIIKYQQ
jgi:hypothetical protein